MGLHPQVLFAVVHSASCYAGTNRAQSPVILVAPRLPPSPPHVALPFLLTSGLSSSRIRRRRAAAAGKPQAAVGYGFDRWDLTPLTVSRPDYIARNTDLPRNALPSQVLPGPFIDPVPTVPIQHDTDAITPAPYFTSCTPSRRTSACHHPSRSSRDAITGRSRVHQVCQEILAHRSGV